MTAPVTLFVNASQVVTCSGPPRARRGAEMRDAVALERRRGGGGRGPHRRGRRPRDRSSARTRMPTRIDCARGVLTPGLVDSHTHAIFGRPRSNEHEMRAAGLGYMEIAAKGGGIHASVRDLRTRGEDELVELARARLTRLASYGTTTVEVKSGYGLTVDDELKMLRAIARLAAELPMRIVPTWLGAHEIPMEARSSEPRAPATCGC